MFTARQRAALGLSCLLVPVVWAGGVALAQADVFDDSERSSILSAVPMDSISDDLETGIPLGFESLPGSKAMEMISDESLADGISNDNDIEDVVVVDDPDEPMDVGGNAGSDLSMVFDSGSDEMATSLAPGGSAQVDEARPVSTNDWSLDISLGTVSLAVGSSVIVSPRITGTDADGFTYNYGWNYEGSWASWDSTVLSTGAHTTEVAWTFCPTRPGKYQIFIDAVDPSGAQRTTEVWLDVKDWDASIVSSSTEVVQGAAVTITPAIHNGPNEGFTYNYGWNYEGAWVEWNSTVLESGSYTDKGTWAFRPMRQGRYQLFVDVVDPAGNKKTYQTWVQVNEPSWGASLSLPSGDTPLGQGVNVKVKPSVADSTGYSYNYVWNYEGAWQEWGSTILDIGSRTSDSQWSFVPKKAGRYQVFVDVVDASGAQKTISGWVTVSETWTLQGVQIGKASLGQPVELSISTSGNTSALQYQFVWEKDGWSQWGVIRGVDPASTASWVPTVSGKVGLYFDVIDSQGNKTTKSIDVDVADEGLSFASVKVSQSTDLSYGDMITIEPQCEASTKEYLSYRYRWERILDGETGVIKDWSNSPEAQWDVTCTGDVRILVDIRDSSGAIQTQSTIVHVVSEQWSYEGVLGDANLIKVGESVRVTPQLSGAIDHVTYQYVWEKDGWKEWGVLQKPTAGATSFEWTPTEPGFYTLHCDVIGSDGAKITKTWGVTVWQYQGVEVTWLGGGKWLIHPNLGIPNQDDFDFSYNYVWNRDGAWDHWGSTFASTGSRTASSSWTYVPDQPGHYEIYVDVVDPSGRVETRGSSVVGYAGSNYGMWNHVQNYKSATNYLLACDTTSNRVGVYHDVDGHWEELAQWACSSGAPSTPTIKGVFEVGIRGYYFDSFGSRCFYYTQFSGDYLFHSTLYYANGAPMDSRLGLNLSHGCVRLSIENAKWIYDNIPRNTTVVVY